MPAQDCNKLLVALFRSLRWPSVILDVSNLADYFPNRLEP